MTIPISVPLSPEIVLARHERDRLRCAIAEGRSRLTDLEVRLAAVEEALRAS